MRTVVIFLCCCLLLPLSGRAQEKASETDVLKFCVFPDKSARMLYSIYMPLVERLKTVTGKQIKLVTAPSKEEFQKRAMAGEYDMAVACVACYFLLREQGYEAVVQGSPSFRGAVIVKKESNFTTPMQLQGKKVAAMRKHSYAGYLFFHSYFLNHRLEHMALPQYLFQDQLDSSLLAVLNGQADACVVRLDALNSSKIAAHSEEFRIILRSIPIPQFPLLVAPGFNPQVKSKIVKTLVSLTADDPAVEKLFSTYRINSFVKTSDRAYQDFEKEYLKARRTIQENHVQ